MGNDKWLPGGEGNSGQNGFDNFLNGITGFITAVLGITFFWPIFLPLAGTGANYQKILPLNWILEGLWLIFLAWFIPRMIKRIKIKRQRQLEAWQAQQNQQERQNRTYPYNWYNWYN